MPVEVVDLDLTAETGAIPQPTFTDVGLVGTAGSSPSGADFGEVNRYTTASDVADDYGTDTDVHVASQAVEEMGASYWYVVVLEETETTETGVADGDTLSNTPVLGTPVPTAATETLSFSTEDPPDHNNEDTEVALNTDTGDVSMSVTDDDLTYSYVDWSQLDKPEWSDNVNRVVVADRRMGREHIGTLDEIVSLASGNEQGVVAAGINGSTAADDDTAMTEYHDVFGYVGSGDLLAVAHKSSDDVAAYIAGQLAINDPWFDPFYDGDGYPFNTDYYQRALVGDPATAGTFEGGDAANQEGPVNVIINKAGTTVLSNSITTAGSSSNYQFYDVGRTQDFLAAEVKRELTSLRLREDQIPFTPAGRAQIVNVIRNTISQYVGGGGPLADFTVTVPAVADLTDSEKANRTWAGININVTLAGNVHEFSVTLNLTV